MNVCKKGYQVIRKKAVWLLIIMLMLVGIPAEVRAEDEDTPKELKNLYAQSAVLMDADSGRVLFGKKADEVKAMASTTKIMTCILALENGNLDDQVEVSDKADGQPKVRLGIKKGEKYYLKDLLYSLMLESHNDSAVAIAEHIGGSQEGFAEMMNQKAKELGCTRTYFITPNGLDAEDAHGKHTTTAADLALIMRYCIKESNRRAEFLSITGQKSYSFADVADKRMFQCSNHNAFLGMMSGAFSGKTGFTADAGYCYVGALKRDGKTLIVSLLGCGWPNNKGYKWKDTRKLMEYGLANYQQKNVWKDIDFDKIPIEKGIPDSGRPGTISSTGAEIKDADTELMLLLHNNEQVEVRCEVEETLTAPVKKGQKIGEVTYYLAGKPIRKYAVVTKKAAARVDLRWCFRKVFDLWAEFA